MDHTIKHPSIEGAYAVVRQDHFAGWILESVIVPEDRRGEGVGTALVLQVLAWCKDRGIKRLFFLASNMDFWERLREKYPKNVKIDFNFNGELRP